MGDDTIRLLIVEDNPVHVRLALEMLKEGSTTVRFDVATADSLNSASDYLREMNYDAILLDLGLPDSQGLDSLHSLSSKYPGIPIIVLTVLEDEESAIKAVASGAQDYIIKGHTEGAVLIRSIRYAVERKRAEYVLRESEKKYREVVETMNDVVFTLDFDGGVLEIGSTINRIIGRSREEIIGKRFADFVHPDDLQRAEEEFLRAIQGIGRPLEIRVFALDGTPKWIRINALLIMKDGEPENLLCTLTNITEKKLSEEALRESEKKYRLVVDSAAEAIMVGQDGMIRLANPMTTTITGFSEQELMSKPFPLFVHQDDRVMLMGHHERRLRGEAVPARYVFRMIAKDGSTKWLEMSGVSIEWEGRLATLNFMTDVTERKKAETELYISLLDLTKARDSLELSEEKFRALANTTTDWVYWISPKGDFVFNSPSALKISGHRSEEFLSDPDLLIQVIHPDDRDRFQKHLTECTSPVTLAESCEIEFRILKKDGGVRWISHTCGPIVDKNNKSLGRRASNRDITNRKHAEEELASALTRLKEAHHLAHIGAWDWLIENDTVIWSEELYRIAGRDPSLPAPTFAEHPLHYAPTSWEKLDCAVKSTLTTGEPYNLELELIRPDGSIRWTNAIGGVKRDERGKIIGLHGLLQDITERKRAEYQSNERMKELRAFFHLAEIVEREGITLERLYQEFVNVLPESWQYPEIACARIVLGGEEFRTENYMDAAWKQSAPIKVNKAARGTVEICYLEERPEADEGPFLKEERQLIDAIAERLGHIIGRKLADLELINETIAATESRQKAEAYFDFLAHDIANILSPMVAYADMLKARPNNPEQVTKFSSKILEQGKRASSLISNLRRLESIERTHPNEIDTIDLRTLFSSLEDEIQSGFPDKEVAISYDIPDVPSMTVKGGEWVENVLRCVYDNAVRYSTGSAVELEISASMLREEGGEPFWQIEVSDHGPGIPDNIKNHFGESLTVASDREFKGVASSLPFCVSMIRCLGGELLVQDRIPGDHKQGTRITIRLPRSE